MADQQSGQAALTNVVGTWYSKKILQSFEPETVFYTAAPIKEPIPMASGKTINFDRYKKVAALYKDDTNEYDAQQMYLSAEVISATLHERDGFIQLSRYTVLTARGRALDRAAEKIQFAAAQTLDKLVRNDIGCIVADKAVYSANAFDNLAIDGGTLNSSGITARIWTRRADGFPIYHNKTRIGQSSTVVSIAASGMTVKTLQHGVRVLEGNDVPTLMDGNYRFLCHPDVSYQITTNAGFKGWVSPTSSEEMKKSPIRRDIVAGASIQTSTLGYKFPVSGDTLSTSSGNVYLSLLFGDEAYGVSEVSGANGGAKGFQFFLKQSGPTTVSDPTNKKKQAAFSITAVAKVLNKSAGIWIATTGT
jgi:N4-gp56 family major capsid protein